ncbi:alpha/beta hydrolase [Actinoplanes sp. RD1]|uniref:alpha/beta hydrolase n=1 Tax=Actinoplanes sp. RD1 TaxID=3064538 RepID=UPI0027415306|nr:alpha/beta hydrolase [Actinoplanes sp. RD1]
MRRILATGVLLGLVMSGGSVAVAAPAAKPAIKWGACSQPALKARAECGFLSVPLDHARPKGPKIQLAVSRVKHTVPEAQYQGVMLVNPGGPGGSGLAMSPLGGQVPRAAGAAYDWIGFDPRGVGASRPALSCDPSYQRYGRPQYVPASAAIEKDWRKRAAKYAAACDRAGGALLDHLKTTDTVRDMDLLRAALGAEKINFYGYSYGTYLGQVYATLFPQRVRRMVLDGVVNPGRVWYDANLDQDLAFDRNMKRYFAWIAKHDAVYHLGRTGAAVEKLFYAQQAQLTRKPAAGAFGGNELTDVFLQAGYYVFGWDTVATAFSAFVRDRDPAGLRKLFEEANPGTAGSDNGYAVYLATQCTDVQWPLSWSKWRADNWRVHARAPFETWGNAWFNAPCLTWGAKAGRPVAVDGRKAPPILLVSETFDAATPYSGALAVRRLFPRSALVEGVGGTTHSGSLFGGACVDGTVAAYLATGELPRRVKADMSDRKCAPVPQPAPVKAGVPKRESADLRDLLRSHIR